MKEATKFNCYWNQSVALIGPEPFSVLNYWRDVLHNMELVGAYENGVSFGNLSLRDRQSSRFFIPGAGTGEIPVLEPGHYLRVDGYNFKDNAVQCTGPLKTSSESLSHAAVYYADAGTNAIIHIYSIELWEKLKGKVPSTDPQYEFGSMGLANDIFRIFKETDAIEKRIIIIGGDRAGLIAFGNDMDEAINILMQYIEEE